MHIKIVAANEIYTHLRFLDDFLKAHKVEECELSPSRRNSLISQLEAYRPIIKNTTALENLKTHPFGSWIDMESIAEKAYSEVHTNEANLLHRFRVDLTKALCDGPIGYDKLVIDARKERLQNKLSEYVGNGILDKRYANTLKRFPFQTADSVRLMADAAFAHYSKPKPDASPLSDEELYNRIYSELMQVTDSDYYMMICYRKVCKTGILPICPTAREWISAIRLYHDRERKLHKKSDEQFETDFNKCREEEFNKPAAEEARRYNFHRIAYKYEESGFISDTDRESLLAKKLNTVEDVANLTEFVFSLQKKIKWYPKKRPPPAINRDRPPTPTPAAKSRQIKRNPIEVAYQFEPLIDEVVDIPSGIPDRAQQQKFQSRIPVRASKAKAETTQTQKPSQIPQKTSRHV